MSPKAVKHLGEISTVHGTLIHGVMQKCNQEARMKPDI